METDGTLHRLAAIISGDIVGYSRLIGSDEAVAVRLVTAYREEVELLVRQNDGTLVDFTGDNFPPHFSSSFLGFSILGIAHIQLGNLEQGRVRLEEAVLLNPMAVDINYTMLGFAQLHTGDPDSAVKLWERVRAENAVDLMALLGAVPEEMESVFTGNFKLAGLP